MPWFLWWEMPIFAVEIYHTMTYKTFYTLVLAMALCWPTTLSAQEPNAWMGTWAAAAEFTGKQDMPKEPLTERALREIVQVSIGGDCLRLRLSNEFSRQPVELKAVFIADALDSCDIAVKSAKYLSFGGKRNVTIQPGQCVWSDICKYALKPLQRLAVTINYGQTPEHATSHRGSRTTSYIIKGEAKPKTSFAQGERVDHWYSIAAIDVPAAGNRCMAVLGNSITDGRGSTTNLQNRWPDMMSQALQKTYGQQVGVLNLGIGGNCVLAGGLSEPALKRFDRDILCQNGVTDVIIFEAINDIGGSKGRSEKVANDLIEAYKQFIKKVHDRGMRVILCTITPYGKSFYDDTFFKEAARQTVNKWIRTNKEADGFIDFDELMRDPEHPTQLREDLQEDWLHPNAKGYKVMGEYAAKCILGLK